MSYHPAPALMRASMFGAFGLGALPDGAIPIEGRARLADRGFIVIGSAPAGATHFVLTPYDADNQPLHPTPGVTLPIHHIVLSYYTQTGERVGPLDTFMHRDAVTPAPTPITSSMAPSKGGTTSTSSKSGTTTKQPSLLQKVSQFFQPSSSAAPTTMAPVPTTPSTTPTWIVPAAVIGGVVILAGAIYALSRPPRRRVAANRRRRRRRPSRRRHARRRR